jgi:superfamily II DNA helicase RecQ
LEGELKAIVGPKAQFRGMQEGVLRAIMAQKSPVVVIIGIGSGKSILFILPSQYSIGLTIVVVLLILLRKDLRDRYRSVGIECTK